jgi:hypothetical protein
MASKYKQGTFEPKNPHKYVGKRLANGKPDIVYRSSWEKKVMIWLDQNESVVSWNSEDIVIPYLYPIDNKMHRYFVDMIATFKIGENKFKTILIEIKPKAETMEPKPPKRQTKKSLENFERAIQTYIKNTAKWKAAREYAQQNKIEFMIITEEHIFGR